MDKNYRTHEGDQVRERILEFLKARLVTVANVSYREILENIGLKSTSTVEFHLKHLEAEGKIKLSGTRSIEVLE